MKICLACSAGGHLTELMQIKEAFEGYDYFLVTFRRDDTKNLSAYYVEDPKRNPLKFLKNLFQAARVLFKEKPDVIITTGAGVVVPLCYLGKISGVKIIFIESFARIDSKSFSGIAIYPIADLFFVQWKSLLGKYGNRAQYGGGVF